MLKEKIQEAYSGDQEALTEIIENLSSVADELQAEGKFGDGAIYSLYCSELMSISMNLYCTSWLKNDDLKKKTMNSLRKTLSKLEKYNEKQDNNF